MTATRDKILQSANELYREYGYRGTSMQQIIKHSGTAAGSVYHHFPGGKEEIAAAALTNSGASYQVLVQAVLTASPNLASGIAALFKSGAKVLQETDYLDPCPVGTVAREIANSHPKLRDVSHQVLQRWVNAASNLISNEVCEPERADDFAVLLVAAIEGGFLLSRTARSPEPMLAIGRSLVASLEESYVA